MKNENQGEYIWKTAVKTEEEMKKRFA